jgi:hypothetical protein
MDIPELEEGEIRDDIVPYSWTPVLESPIQEDERPTEDDFLARLEECFSAPDESVELYMKVPQVHELVQGSMTKLRKEIEEKVGEVAECSARMGITLGQHKKLICNALRIRRELRSACSLMTKEFKRTSVPAFPAEEPISAVRADVNELCTLYAVQNAQLAEQKQLIHATLKMREEVGELRRACGIMARRLEHRKKKDK